MLSVKINNQRHEFEEGLTVLQALRAAGQDVPTLCSDERLKPQGNCRLCLVKVKGANHPLTACTTRLADGMEIETHTPDLERARHMILRMLAQDYPAEALGKFPEKNLHRYFRQYGVEPEHSANVGTNLVDDSHPYIRVDMARCVACRRCVQICEEVQGQFVWRIFNRGKETRILPNSQKNLLESSCVSCGACVDTCPTGALEDRSVLSYGVPTRWTRTTCPYCGVGCEMNVGVRNHRVVSIRPALDAPVNRGHLCVKGRYSFDFVHASDRITEQ